MELVSYKIPRKQADHTPIVIAPIGDIQWSGQRGPTAKDLLRRHLDRCLELDAWYVGLGDYIDFLSPSNRQRLKAAALYDTAEDVIDDKAIDLTLELYQDFLKPTKGRWLGMLHGHHFATLKTGETTDQRLCQLLETRFLGTSAFIRLQFDIRNTRGNVVIWAHHGCGGGMSPGSPLNKLERAAMGFTADIYLMGHTTKSPAAPLKRVDPRWHGRGAPDLADKKVLLINTGGFAKSYAKGSMQGRVPMGGYAEQGMMNPAYLGAPLIHIRPTILTREQPKRNGRRVQSTTWAPEVTVEV